MERATHPGIVRHWMLRKKWIELRVRAAIADGADQVVVLGAGFDTLGVRMAVERPDYSCGRDRSSRDTGSEAVGGGDDTGMRRAGYGGVRFLAR